MKIRQADIADLAAIMAVEDSGFEEPERWSSDLWRSELAAGDRLILVAENGSADSEVGIVAVISVQVLPPASDLMRLVVAPQVRRQGIATRLITAGLDAAARAGAEHMMLEVRYDNVAAIECYGRAGFEQLTVRENYYGAGKDAMVMRAWELQDRLNREVAGR